jgi:hypothetical protein
MSDEVTEKKPLRLSDALRAHAVEIEIKGWPTSLSRDLRHAAEHIEWLEALTKEQLAHGEGPQHRLMIFQRWHAYAEIGCEAIVKSDELTLEFGSLAVVQIHGKGLRRPIPSDKCFPNGCAVSIIVASDAFLEH